MNNNYNNFYCDYIGALGSYSITDYVDNTSNILHNEIIYTSNILNLKISYTSNILNTKIDYTSNILDTKYSKLIREISDGTLKNTYVTNSNIQGQIRFTTRYDTNDYRYLTRIRENGELEVYYSTFNALFPTVFTGWYSVMNSIRDAYNYQVVAGELIGGALFAINDLYQKVFGLIATTGAAFDKYTAQDLTTQRFAEIVVAASMSVKYNKFNQVQALLGITGIGVAGIAYSVLNGIRYDSITNNILNNLSNLDLNYYSNITLLEKNTALSNIILDTTRNLYDFNSNLTTLNIFNGFINCNIQSQQFINNLRVNNLDINNINVNNIFVASNVLSNLNINQGFINCNIQYQQFINNLRVNNLDVNNGNITNINGLAVNEIIASGKIKENNISLDNTYLTSNHLYNLALNYSSERQYPSKLYTTSSPETTVSLLGKQVYKQILYLDNTLTAYGNGFYEVYSSSTYDNGVTNKDKLFNFNTTETTNTPRWGINLYNSGNGNYQGDNSIDGVYYGDWVILKVPQEILLTKFRIYKNTAFTEKAPSLWKCYGSKDGVSFVEISQGSQTTRLTASNYTSGYYEKVLNSGFSTLYNYIGFTFSALVSTSGNTDLDFAELQIYGKEVLGNSITSNIYTTSNAVKNIVQYDMPIVAKHYGFYISITTPIVINGTTYYKYDIDLRQYTQLGVIQIGPQSGDTFRSFKIRIFYATMFFSYIINDLPNVCYYEVFYSYKNTAAPPNGAAGLNACAIGYPPNTKLQSIMPNNLFIIKNGQGSIDYITVVSTNPADVRCIIEDMIG